MIKKILFLYCEDIINTSTIYDRTLFKNKFKDIYNENKYNFPLNNNMLSNIITKWKNNSNKFTKFCIFENQCSMSEAGGGGSQSVTHGSPVCQPRGPPFYIFGKFYKYKIKS